MVAPQSLNLLVGVRVPIPQPKEQHPPLWVLFFFCERDSNKEGECRKAFGRKQSDGLWVLLFFSVTMCLFFFCYALKYDTFYATLYKTAEKQGTLCKVKISLSR